MRDWEWGRVRFTAIEAGFDLAAAQGSEPVVNTAHSRKNQRTLDEGRCNEEVPANLFWAVSFFMIATYRSVWFAIIFQLRVRLVRIVASAPLWERSMRRWHSSA
jgi:hypothetical protein